MAWIWCARVFEGSQGEQELIRAYFGTQSGCEYYKVAFRQLGYHVKVTHMRKHQASPLFSIVR
eukprot:9001334-Karenia_brevis.AAC.1